MGTKYSSKTISGYNATPPPDDGTQAANNEITWAVIKTKLPDPIRTLVESMNTALVDQVDESASDKATNYTTTASDYQRTINATAAVTIDLGDASTMTAGYIVRVRNQHTAAITVGRATGTDTINGTAADITIDPNCAHTFLVNSTANGYLILDQFYSNAKIKSAYESNSDTNAFTDANQTKLSGIATGAEVNPDVVSQAEAEAGTATTERIWTAERVSQAIDALAPSAVTKDFRLISTVTPTASSFIEIIWVSGTYREIILAGESLNPASDGVEVYMEFGTTAGTYYTDVNDYESSAGIAINYNHGTNTDKIRIADTVGSNSNESINFDVTCVGFDSNRGFPTAFVRSSWLDTSGNAGVASIAGVCDDPAADTVAFNRVRFYVSTGNWATNGNIKVYGYNE